MLVFFSYPRSLNSVVREVRSHLPPFLLSWIHEVQMPHGVSIRDRLQQTIGEATFVAMFLDRGALRSSWIRREIKWSLSRERKLSRTFVIPVAVDTSDKFLPTEIRQKKYLTLVSAKASSVQTFAIELTNAIFQNLIEAYDHIARSVSATPSRAAIEAKGSSYSFAGADIPTCHAAIYERRDELQDVVNFTSVVTNPEYRHPPTARLARQRATEREVKASFLALHPEYARTRRGWWNEKEVRAALDRLPKRFRIEHGPRMFAFPQGDRQNHSLLRLALDRLSSHPTRAYLSLHEPERDLLGGGEPPPGLVGLQFIRKDDRLHIVGHFRHIELSFWWIVNMYEMGRILDWAYDLNKGWAKGKGSIVVQASFASWRSDDPRPIFDSRLDTLPLGDLFDVIVRVGESRIDGLSELSSLLKNKLSHTSEYNIDLAGLSHIQEVLEGVRRMNLRQRRTNGKHLRQLADMISGVTHLLAAAMVESEIDAVRDSVTKAKSELQRAIMSIDRRLAARRNSLASNS